MVNITLKDVFFKDKALTENLLFIHLTVPANDGQSFSTIKTCTR